MAKSDTSHHDERIANMKFASVYPHYVTKVEKKGRTIEELHMVMEWLTGYSHDQIISMTTGNITFKEFFDNCTLNPNASLIKGVICGYRVEDITNPITKQARYLDKIIDELAKGRKLDKIMRS